jgi:hypothetical protein
MTSPQTESVQIADCEIREQQDNARLEMNRRARGVRYARMRCRQVWSEAQVIVRDGRYSFLN